MYIKIISYEHPPPFITTYPSDTSCWWSIISTTVSTNISKAGHLFFKSFPCPMVFRRETESKKKAYPVRFRKTGNPGLDQHLWEPWTRSEKIAKPESIGLMSKNPGSFTKILSKWWGKSSVPSCRAYSWQKWSKYAKLASIRLDLPCFQVFFFWCVAISLILDQCSIWAFMDVYGEGGPHLINQPPDQNTWHALRHTCCFRIISFWVAGNLLTVETRYLTRPSYAQNILLVLQDVSIPPAEFPVNSFAVGPCTLGFSNSKIWTIPTGSMGLVYLPTFGWFLW